MQNSLSWSDLFSDPFADVVLGHHHSGVPELIAGLKDIAARLSLIRAGFRSQVSHLKFPFSTPAASRAASNLPRNILLVMGWPLAERRAAGVHAGFIHACLPGHSLGQGVSPSSAVQGSPCRGQPFGAV